MLEVALLLKAGLRKAALRIEIDHLHAVEPLRRPGLPRRSAPRTRRIPRDVSPCSQELTRIPNEAVVALPLPEVTVRAGALIDPARRVPFDGPGNLLLTEARQRQDQPVNVIRHDNEVATSIPHPIEAAQRVSDYLDVELVAQDAGTVTAIQLHQRLPGLTALELVAVAFRYRLLFDGPLVRGQVSVQSVCCVPRCPLVLPFQDLAGGNGVLESECDKVRGAVLPPVRQGAPVDGDRLEAIKAVELR